MQAIFHDLIGNLRDPAFFHDFLMILATTFPKNGNTGRYINLILHDWRPSDSADPKTRGRPILLPLNADNPLLMRIPLSNRPFIKRFLPHGLFHWRLHLGFPQHIGIIFI